MGLIDQVVAALRRLRPQEQEKTTSAEVRRPVRPTAGLARFRADTERRQIVQTCQRMYRTDTRAKKMLRTLARDVVKGGFVVKVEGDGEVERRAAEIAQALQKRLDVEARLDDWVRLTMRDGDSFLEVGINERMEIAEVTRKPALQMHRNSDEADRFPDPTRAFWWADEIWTGQAPPRDAVWFAEWQVVHARWDHDTGSRYGTPLFGAGTGAWKRVTEGEIDIAVRRKTRAGMKYVHVVEGASRDELEEYKEFNKDALDNPFAAVADFFMNKAGSLEVVQGDARLGEINDVMHHISTWMMAGDVPLELLGYGENLNRDVLREKKAEYDETLEQLRPWVEAELIRPLVELQWLLAGIWPGGLDYSIGWKAKQLVTAADVRDVTDAALKMRALGVREEVIWTVLARYLPGIDVEMLARDENAAEGSPAVMAGTLAALRGKIG